MMQHAYSTTSATIPSRLSNSLRWLGGAVTNLLFPPRCVACQTWGALLCAACAQRVEAVSAPCCQHCGRPQRVPVQRCKGCQGDNESALTLARVAALHTYPLREAIHALKYADTPELAPLLARYLVTTFREQMCGILPRPIDIVVPVPLHEQRLQERGYNQSQLLAAALARSERLQMRADSLLRIRHTATQVGMTASERQRNVAHAFRAHPSVNGCTVLLVDDVYTTGATLRSCASALVVSGARAVYALSLATPTPI